MPAPHKYVTDPLVLLRLYSLLSDAKKDSSSSRVKNYVSAIATYLPLFRTSPKFGYESSHFRPHHTSILQWELKFLETRDPKGTDSHL